MTSLNKLFQMLSDHWGKYAELDDGESGSIPIQLFEKEEFDEAQLGYRLDGAGNSLIEMDGEWQEGWYVVGMEEYLGDPIVVDISNEVLPVFTIMHDAKWTPQYLACSLEKFFERF